MKISSRTKKFILFSSFYIVAVRVLTMYVLSTNVTIANDLPGLSQTAVTIEQSIDAQRV